MSNPNPVHRFQPGVSGNPGGRPKSRLYAQAARELLESNGDMPANWNPDALTNAQKGVLADYRAWVEDRDAAARGAILDRAEGKPASAQEDLEAMKGGDGVTLRKLIGKIPPE